MNACGYSGSPMPRQRMLLHSLLLSETKARRKPSALE